MLNLQRHAQGNLSQLCQFLGIDTPDMAYSTINEKFNVGTALAVPNGVSPIAQYWAIGNGGFYITAYPGDGGVDQKPTPHNTTHTGLFSYTPFVIRPLASDLSSLERQNYRMRVQITHGGQDYWAYYLKKIDISEVSAVLEKRTSVSGSTPVPFAHVTSDMNPTLPVISGGGTVTATGEYAAAMAVVPFVLTQQERDEYMAAINILYDGALGRGTIGEIGIVSGADVLHTVGGVTYTEAAKARISGSLATILPMHVLTDGVTVSVKLESISAIMTLA